MDFLRDFLIKGFFYTFRYSYIGSVVSFGWISIGKRVKLSIMSGDEIIVKFSNVSFEWGTNKPILNPSFKCPVARICTLNGPLSASINIAITII